MFKGFRKYFFVCLVLNVGFVEAQTPVIDSLLNILKKAQADTHKINLLNQIAFEFREKIPLKSLEFAQKADSLAEQMTFKKGKQMAFIHIGWAYYRLGNFPQALQFSVNGLKISEEREDLNAQAQALNNIASVHYEQKNYDLALLYFDKAYDLSKSLKDAKLSGRSLNNLAFVNFEKGDLEKALFFGNLALKNNLAIKDNYLTGFTYRTLGDVFAQKKQFNEALQYFQDALTQARVVGNNTLIVSTLQRIANLYKNQQNFPQALQYFQSTLLEAQKASMKGNIRNAYKGLAEVYGGMNNLPEAYRYQQLFIALNDSLFNEDKTKSLNQMQILYETEKKQAQIDLLKKDQIIQKDEIDKRALIINLFMLAFLFVAVLVFILYRNQQREKRNNILLSKQNQAIKEQKEEIIQQSEELKMVNEELNQINEQLNSTLEVVNNQKNIIEQKNKNITDSINYAQKIQEAMLPDLADIQNALEDSFVFFKPRDIVSGDFYWFAEKRSDFMHKIFISALDCTGHGVPGAFMSMIGNELLNSIVHDKEIYSPEQILTEMHNGIRQSLHQNMTENRDGIDMALCVIDVRKNVMEFAGAHNPLIYIIDNQLQQIKGTKMSIGGFSANNEFEKHHILIQPGMTFYIFSDGLQDQFGGPDGRKFMIRQLREFLLSIHHLPMAQQKQKLNEKLLTWQGNKNQVDDILVMGFRV